MRGKKTRPFLRPVAVEVDRLATVGVATITDVGEENIYFEKDGEPFYCKVYSTERYTVGRIDFSAQ